METIVKSKGRVLIPAEIRRKFGIKEGTPIQVELDEQNRKIILTPITREYVQRLRGKYKNRGLLKAFMAGKKQDMGL